MADIADINIRVETVQLQKASGDLNEFSSSANVAANATKKLTNATRLDTKERVSENAQVDRSTVAINKNTVAIERQNRVREVARGRARRAEKLATGVDPLNGKMARDLGVNRFNTANIAAQFQDIGVTAAMGMNPMTIALQQGTQLSAILNNMGNPLKGLAQAFTQLINPVALLSIGITGLLAAFIQMVDWSKVWDGATNLLVKGLRFLRENVDLVTKALIALMAVGIVMHFGAIVTAVTSTVLAVGKLVIALAPIAASVGAVTALAYGFYKLGEAVGNFAGFDFLTGLKDTVNMMITMFVNGLKVITNAFTIFWNSLKAKAADYIKFIIDVGEKTEKVFSSVGGVFDNGKYLAERIKEYEGMKKAIDQELGVDRTLLTDEGRTNKLLEGTRNMFEPEDYIGKLKPAVENALDWSIEKLTSKTEELDSKLKEAWDKIVKGVEGHRIEMSQEADLLGRIGEDYYITKEKYDLLNQAREAGITLTAEQTKWIEEESIKLGQQADAVDKLNKRFEFAKSTTTSFFTDMNHALREGKTLWEAFGDAVMNVLGKILDKMTEIGVDYLFAGFKGSGLFGGVGQQVYSSPDAVGPFLPSALGSAWDRGIQKYATGGVVGSPTLFGARSGLGLMGEAGPEAIMPLTRGANGELGVKAEGVGGSPVVVNVINNSNSKATVNQRQTNQGTEIDVVIDQLVADKLGTQGTASNTAMNTWNNRQLIAR